jgi:hypothetical protein
LKERGSRRGGHDSYSGGSCVGHFTQRALLNCELLSASAVDIQGGSDKSGILKIFVENHTAQLKIIRFY